MVPLSDDGASIFAAKCWLFDGRQIQRANGFVSAPSPPTSHLRTRPVARLRARLDVPGMRTDGRPGVLLGRTQRAGMTAVSMRRLRAVSRRLSESVHEHATAAEPPAIDSSSSAVLTARRALRVEQERRAILVRGLAAQHSCPAETMSGHLLHDVGLPALFCGACRARFPFAPWRRSGRGTAMLEFPIARELFRRIGPAFRGPPMMPGASFPTAPPRTQPQAPLLSVRVRPKRRRRLLQPRGPLAASKGPNAPAPIPGNIQTVLAPHPGKPACGPDPFGRERLDRAPARNSQRYPMPRRDPAGRMPIGADSRRRDPRDIKSRHGLRARTRCTWSAALSCHLVAGLIARSCAAACRPSGCAR